MTTLGGVTAINLGGNILSLSTDGSNTLLFKGGPMGGVSTGPQGPPGNDGAQGPPGPPGTTDYLALTNRPTLGTAAATDSTIYATAAQGAKADTALQNAGAFEPAGTMAAHVAAADPHTAYALESALGTMAGWTPTASATPATTGAMTVTMGEGIRTITPTGNCTFNASGGVAGQTCTFAVTTTGTTSRTLTFGTNFRKAGTLATGTTSARFFSVTFRCIDGTVWQEIARTAAQT